MRGHESAAAGEEIPPAWIAQLKPGGRIVAQGPVTDVCTTSGSHTARILAEFLAARARGEVTSEELASVIAHELGHVALGHIRRRMIDFTGQNAVFVVLSAFLNRFLPFIGIWIANLISTALMARLSRRDEFEADAYASALLVKAGIGTAPQKSLFRKLAGLTGDRHNALPAWLRPRAGHGADDRPRQARRRPGAV